MHAKPSPFKPGAGLPPPHLAGRERIQRFFKRSLAALQAGQGARNVVMYGPRGMGKTVLLDWLESECDARAMDCVSTDPSTGLKSMEDLPGRLLPASWIAKWLPKEVEAGAKAGELSLWVTYRGKDGKMRQGDLADDVIAACNKRPRVLLLDEAHTLEDRALCRALLNTAQKIARKSPFMLVLTGTPGLREHLRTVKATFVERAAKQGVGSLTHKAAKEAIRKPLQEAGMDIQPDALAQVVDESQRYPFFLQAWGEAIWDALENEPGPVREVTQQHVSLASEAFQRERTILYEERYEAMERSKPLLVAAYAVSLLFAKHTHPSGADIRERIDASLPDQGLNGEAREAKVLEIWDQLQRSDFFWRPPAGQVEAGIPNFMAYTRQLAQRELDSGRLSLPCEGLAQAWLG